MKFEDMNFDPEFCPRCEIGFPEVIIYRRIRRPLNLNIAEKVCKNCAEKLRPKKKKI